MKYLTFADPTTPAQPRPGALLGEDIIIDLAVAAQWAQRVRKLPAEAPRESLFEWIQAGPPAWTYARNLLHALEGEDPLELLEPGSPPVARRLADVALYPPLPHPMSLRDFYAFEQHVAAAHRNRGRPVPEEWYWFPAFYFTNSNSIFGPGETIPYPAYTDALDYELEVACVIGRPAIDLQPETAAASIFGYTIFNDWSARDVQRQEMKVGLGPAKGKDFASSLGPWIVTPDELEPYAQGRPGVYNRQMVARVNGQERSRGNWGDIHYSFGELLARASADTYLLPGDVIGSGTVGSGCLLELTAGQGPWLQPGDEVALEIEGLGQLINRVGAPRRSNPAR